MDANELRIGNYYNYYDRPFKLDGGFLAMYLQNEIDPFLAPIPLNEQWLLDFGYLPCCIRDYHFEIKGHTIWLCHDLFMCDKNGIILKHVHQLQNLYFALTGLELIKKI